MLIEILTAFLIYFFAVLPSGFPGIISPEFAGQENSSCLPSGLSELEISEVSAESIPDKFRRFSFTEYKMGTTFTIILYAVNENTAKLASTEAYKKMDELELVFSDYVVGSEINKLSDSSGSGEFFSASNSLFEVIEKSLFISQKSKGAFDISVGPYVKLWRRAIRQQKLPSPELLNSARAAVGYQHIILNKNSREIKLSVPDMQLDVGGIAKGYILDQAMKVLKSNGISSALIDGGGDILVSNSPPDKEGWILELSSGNNLKHKKNHIRINNSSVATSGDNYRFVEFEGKRYSHIVDPATGYGLIDQYTVSVVAKDGTTADGLASAISVLGPEEGLKFINQIDGAEAYIFSEERQEYVSWQSAGFNSYLHFLEEN